MQKRKERFAKFRLRTTGDFTPVKILKTRGHKDVHPLCISLLCQKNVIDFIKLLTRFDTKSYIINNPDLKAS